MKKRLKSISLILVTLLAVLSFSACGNGDVKDTSSKEAKKAEELVTEFMDAFCEFDMKKAAKCVEDANYDNMPFEDMEDAIDKAMSGIPDEFIKPYEKEFKDLFEDVFNEISKNIEYEIVDEGEADGVYTYELEVSSYNLSIISDAFTTLGTDMSDSDAMTELMNSGKITETMSEEEIMDVMMEYFFNLINDEIDNIFADADKETAEIELIVEEKDGGLIITDDSDVDELEDILSA